MVNSTQQMSRSIADVYAVRRDWFDANKEWVEKFVAGYLKGTEELVAMRKSFQDTNKMSDAYKEILTMSQRTFGADVLPTLDVDAHGLLMDCTFVGLPGQIAFFRDSGNLSGFENKMSEALDLATGWGYAKNRFGFDPNDFDYKKIAERAGFNMSSRPNRNDSPIQPNRPRCFLVRTSMPTPSLASRLTLSPTFKSSLRIDTEQSFNEPSKRLARSVTPKL